MKIIEALKKTKDLLAKSEDLRKKIAAHSADLDIESPVYPDQRLQVSSWLQAHSDVLKEISTLRFRIAKTNVSTHVTIQLTPSLTVTKSIQEWISRRKDLAKLDQAAYAMLTDRNLKEGTWRTSSSMEVPVKIRRYFDPAERDAKMELYRSEPSTIDGALEIVNATTDLVE